MKTEAPAKGCSEPAAKHDTDTIPRRPDNPRPRLTAFQYWLRFDCNRRRREHAELKRLLSNALDNAEPSTFGLEPDELRKHANNLVACGWSVAEVYAVLDVEPVGAP